MKKLLVLILAFLFVLAGCGTSAPVDLPADQARAFAEQVDSVSENVLQSVNNHDYAGFTRDMDAAMKKASPEAGFEQLYQLLTSKVGQYLSRQMTIVQDSGQLRIVTYDVKYVEEDHVTVRIVYNMAGSTPLVSGLWFDSPKLRQQ